MEEESVWCQGCGGGGSDDRPPYVGICKWCGGSGELTKGQYEEMLIAEQFNDILQAAYEDARDLWFKAQEDKTEEYEVWRIKADILESAVIPWWKQFGEDQGLEDAVKMYTEFGDSLEQFWVYMNEPVGD